MVVPVRKALGIPGSWYVCLSAKAGMAREDLDEKICICSLSRTFPISWLLSHAVSMFCCKRSLSSARQKYSIL